MELVTDQEGNVAPRLGDVALSEEQALEDHAVMMEYIIRMLCAGVIHGDLSEFNVLVDDYGPVIIDLPQAVDASANNNAEWMLERDVNKITSYYAHYAPQLLDLPFAKEMWALYEEGELHPETKLTGVFEESGEEADVDVVMLEIKAVLAEERERQERAQEAEEEG